MKNYYRFKCYINARHCVELDGVRSPIHSHTWEVAIFVKVSAEAFLNFTRFEMQLKTYFSQFEGRYLNELNQFQSMNPTMENIGKFFCNELEALLNNQGLWLERIEISENPTRTYIIENDELSI